MKIVADAHVHVYPCYRMTRWVDEAATGLAGCVRAAGAPESVRALFLAESAHCRVWEDWAEGRSVPDAPWAFRVSPEPGAGEFTHPAHGGFWVFAGRQVVTEERIEVLSLLSGVCVADGLPLDETLQSIREGNGLAVLAWAPGKWMGGRGRRVAALLEQANPAGLWAGDNRMRPGWVGDSPSLKKAQRRGIRVLAGSDPLPFPGEEKQIGRYAAVFEAEFDRARPVTSMRAALAAAAGPVRRVGTRNGLLECVARFQRNQKARVR